MEAESVDTISLSDYAVMLADSGVYDGGYVTPTALDAADYIASSDTASMLANYALLSEVDDGGISASDTADMLDPYIREAEVLAYNYIAASDISTTAPILSDRQNLSLFGSGVGLAGDTALIDDDLNGYGYYEVPQDSTTIQRVVTTIPSGDSVNYYLVSGTTLWTPIDTIATIAADAGETVTTSFTEDTYVAGRKIWIEMGAEVSTRKPIMFRVLMQGILKRD